MKRKFLKNYLLKFSLVLFSTCAFEFKNNAASTTQNVDTQEDLNWLTDPSPSEKEPTKNYSSRTSRPYLFPINDTDGNSPSQSGPESPITKPETTTPSQTRKSLMTETMTPNHAKEETKAKNLVPEPSQIAEPLISKPPEPTDVKPSISPQSQTPPITSLKPEAQSFSTKETQPITAEPPTPVQITPESPTPVQITPESTKPVQTQNSSITSPPNQTQPVQASDTKIQSALPQTNSQTVSPQVKQEAEKGHSSTQPPQAPTSENTTEDVIIDKNAGAPPKTILINFNNVSIIEYIRFISKISNKNFVFDENDLQFSVTIISEEPTTIENVMTALLQELRIHDLLLLEQGNNLIIHKSSFSGSIATVVAQDLEPISSTKKEEIVTQVFLLGTVEAEKAATVIKHLASPRAIIDVLRDTNHLIITDLAANIFQMGRLLKSIDAPQSGLVIGQYLVKVSFLETLIHLGEQIMQPVAQGQTVLFVPQKSTNSIFIVSTPYLVETGLAILQRLDQTEGLTQILTPKDLKFEIISQAKKEDEAQEEKEKKEGQEGQGGLSGQWKLGENGNWEFETSAGEGKDTLPEGNWIIDSQGNWFFQPGPLQKGSGENRPDGQWTRNASGKWVFKLAPGKTIAPERLARVNKYNPESELPVGHIERTQFLIHKLLYRKGDQITRALGKIAESLQGNGTTNTDLVSSINSVQWIESSNALIFTGTAESLEKVNELIEEIDTPLRQVFLEMLILSVSLDDSLTYSVNVGSRFGGGDNSGSQAWLSGASALAPTFDTAGLTGVPDASASARLNGYNLGIIGRNLTHNGTVFGTIGALISANHTKTYENIVLNPKILTEDNSPAEIFVGENTQFPTQAITNDQGAIITQNFEFRDVGTRVKVTPLIGNNNIITLEIEQEVSNIISGGTVSGNTSTQVIGPTTSISRTTTKVHMPSGYFLIISGQISDNVQRSRAQVPCLGGIPFLGAAFSDKLVSDQKRNLLIFINPTIIDTSDEMQELTKRQQDIFKVKKRSVNSWKYETNEALDFFNLEDTLDSEGLNDCN